MTRRLLPVLLPFVLMACAPSPEAPPPGSDATTATTVPPASAEQEPSVLPVRLAQVFVLPGHLPWEIQAEMEKARASGATAVALRAFQLAGDRPHGWAGESPSAGVYFPTPESGAPTTAPDLLGVFVEAAHAEGLEAWAWMTTLDCRWMLEQDPDLAGYEWDPIVRQLARTRKLDPFHPGVRIALRRLFRDLGRSGVDGVLFQDDLVLRHLEGFGPHAAHAWKESTAGTLEPGLFYENVRRLENGKLRVGSYTGEYRQWSRWRAERLLDLAEELGDAARGASGRGRHFTVCLNVYYDELWNPDGGLLWLARDFDLALGRRFDRYAVMAYHRQIGEETDREGDDLREVLDRMAERLQARELAPERIIVKLQTVDWRSKEALAASELEWAAAPWLERAGFSIGLAPWDPEAPAPFPQLAAAASGAARSQ